MSSGEKCDSQTPNKLISESDSQDYWKSSLLWRYGLSGSSSSVWSSKTEDSQWCEKTTWPNLLCERKGFVLMGEIRKCGSESSKEELFIWMWWNRQRRALWILGSSRLTKLIPRQKSLRPRKDTTFLCKDLLSSGTAFVILERVRLCLSYPGARRSLVCEGNSVKETSQWPLPVSSGIRVGSWAIPKLSPSGI